MIYYIFPSSLIPPPCLFYTNKSKKLYSIKFTTVINHFHPLLFYYSLFKFRFEFLLFQHFIETSILLPNCCYFINFKPRNSLSPRLFVRYIIIPTPIVAGGFARDVVDDAVDVGYFVHDTGADGLQDFPRDASKSLVMPSILVYGFGCNRVVVRSYLPLLPTLRIPGRTVVLPYVAFKAVWRFLRKDGI